jgi:uncharacterized protein (TIGR02246 family)
LTRPSTTGAPFLHRIESLPESSIEPTIRLVLWTGHVWKGRTAIEVGHAEVHKTVFRNSVQRKRIEELTFAGQETAVVRSFDTLTGDERSPDKVVRSRKLLVVTKRDGIWKIAWGQNTRLADSTPD